MDTSTTQLQLHDMGDYYSSWFIENSGGFPESPNQRIVLIGASEQLIFLLLRDGYTVVHVDKDPTELQAAQSSIALELSPQESQRFESVAADAERDEFAFRPNDIVCLVRSLHHMKNPAQALRKICEQVGNVVVCDSSCELLKEAMEVQRQAYMQFTAELGDDPVALEKCAREYEADRKIDQRCLELIGALNLQDEASVNQFLTQSGFDLSTPGRELYYALRCPCGSPHCFKKCYYWFLVTTEVKIPSPYG